MCPKVPGCTTTKGIPRPFSIGVFTSAAITKNCYDSWFQLGLQVSGVSYYYDILFSH